MDPSRSQRLFFALCPDEIFRTALVDLTEKSLQKRGKRVSSENLHVTLVFLGSTDREQRLCAEAVAREMATEPFTLTFDRLGHWPRQRVLWSAPSEVPQALRTLVNALNRGLRRCGFSLETRPYHVHLTVARNITGPVPDARHEPLVWPVHAFHLVESETRPAGARYRVIGTWPLCAAQRPSS
nr:RNA 2',3'-cyclic phosphodiesterase [Gammaproteobacteria bacterium]